MKIRRALLAIVILGCIPATAVRASLIGVTDTGDVYSIDESNGAPTLIGSNADSSLKGITRDSTGTYYANDWGNSFQFGSLTTINPSTGAKGADVNSGNLYLKDMAFSAGDVLYVITDDSGPDGFGTVNAISGAYTQIDRSHLFLEAMAFVGSTLYAAEDGGIGLVTIDTATGATTDVNPSEGGGWAGMTYSGGTLYGVSGGSLYSIDTTTGVETFIGGSDNINGSYRGLAPLEANEVNAVPEPSTVALGGMGALGLIIAAGRRRRLVRQKGCA